MFERGLAYRRRSTVNWCPSRQHGAGQRAGGRRRAAGAAARPVEQRDLEQWFFRITAYADDLLAGADDAVAVAREGADDAAQLDRPIRGRARRASPLDGEPAGDRGLHHPHRHDLRRDLPHARRPSIRWSARFAEEAPDPQAFTAPADALPRARTAPARVSGEVEKEGFFTGRYAVNPFTGERVPVWVANFVLGEYGTGAVMGVPGARPARFRVRAQVRPADAGGRRSRRRAGRCPTWRP